MRAAPPSAPELIFRCYIKITLFKNILFLADSRYLHRPLFSLPVVHGRESRVDAATSPRLDLVII
jgi:hypothetical protein